MNYLPLDLNEVWGKFLVWSLNLPKKKQASLNEVLNNIHTTLVASTYFIKSLIINENSMSKT